MKFLSIASRYRWLQVATWNHPTVFTNACILMPIFFGFISLYYGADTNWDLMNYHLYNPHAFLHDKLKVDLAPAGMQSYFNPALDFPYYWMVFHFPAPLVGFICGVVHGINFSLVALIARRLLHFIPSNEKFSLPLLLAFFGCLTGNFLSAVGNSMGDNTTAIFILLSLYLNLHCEKYFSHAPLKFFAWLLIAGFSAGLATGLKLTNVVFAISLCISFFILPLSWFARLRNSFLFGVGVLAGIAITGGYWFYEMWLHFGNPFFPQFSNFFPHELTHSIGIADTRWGPKNVMEFISWPIFFSFNPLRAGELRLYQIIWAVAYGVMLWWLFKMVFKKSARDNFYCATAATHYFIVFLCVSFWVWMSIFSIQRYLVAIEVCAPLLIFIVIALEFEYVKAKKISLIILCVTTAIVLLGGLRTWGHADWSKKMFSSELPTINEPANTSVILVGGDPVFGWLSVLFPASVTFAQIDGNFPANRDIFQNKLHQVVKDNSRSAYAIFQAYKETAQIKKVNRINSVLSTWNINSDERGCNNVQSILGKLNVRQMKLIRLPNGAGCLLEAVELSANNEDFKSIAAEKLRSYGFILDANSCVVYNAFIGKNEYPFHWCTIRELH